MGDLFQVTTSELNPPGSKHQVLMLAESEQERHRWVGALNELHKLLRKNKLPNKAVSHTHSMNSYRKIFSLR